MTIDLDGAPNCYAPRGSGLPALDAIDNAVPLQDRAGHAPYSLGWVPTYKSTYRNPRTGASVIQASGPTRGFYISETSLKDAFHGSLSGISTDVRYQTDATTYPYLALPLHFLKSSKLQVGDYALAIHGHTGAYSFAVFADAKNRHVFGESSSALAAALGVPAGRHGGIARGIVYIVFPDSGLGSMLRPDVRSVPINGKRWLDLYDEKLDVIQQVTRCFNPEYPGVATAFRRI